MDCGSGILSLILTIEYYIKENIDDKEMPQAITAEKQMIGKIETWRMEIGVILHMFFITYWRRPPQHSAAAKEQSHCQRKPSSVRCSGRNMAGPSSHGSIQVQVHFGTQGLRRWGPWSTGPRRQRCGVRFFVAKLPNYETEASVLLRNFFCQPATWNCQTPCCYGLEFPFLPKSFVQRPRRGWQRIQQYSREPFEDRPRPQKRDLCRYWCWWWWRRIWIVRSKKLNEFWKRKKTSARSLKEQRGEILCKINLLSTVHPLNIVYFSMFFLIFLGYR